MRRRLKAYPGFVEPEQEFDEETESGQALIQLGAETLGGLGGAAAGMVLGPPGALAGAAAGPVIVRAVAWAGQLVRHRLLSQNEEARIGTALYVALERVKEREDAGEHPREDGLFEPGTDPRGMLEGTLLAAARSYDELKVPYIGAFYAAFVFEEDVGVNVAHFLLSLWDRLTYHSLCTLAYFADLAFGGERLHIQAAAEEEGTKMSPMLAAELTELTNLGLLGVRGEDGRVTAMGSTVGTLGGGAETVAKVAGSLAPMDLGAILVRMAELDKIQEGDKREIADELRGRRGQT